MLEEGQEGWGELEVEHREGQEVQEHVEEENDANE